nr:AP-3 complex subunit beta-2 isoform X1 [Onthophagus taurus]
MANNIQYGNERTNSLETEYGIDPASGGFFHVDTKNYFRHEDLKEMLDSNKDSLKLEAMKRIIGMIAKGRDASMLFPAVVKNVVSKNIEVKKLVYVYLERYAEEQQDLALLSISTFQRALKEPNQLIRAGALRVLSSIRVNVIAPIVMIAIRDAAQDMSPYVRKTAAHAIPKLHSLDKDTKPELVMIIQKLLADKTVLVIGSAVMAFTKVCPERVDLVHQVYRKLCNVLVDVDEWGQVIILNTLTRYCRTQFADPNIHEKKQVGKSGETDSDTSDKHSAGPTLDPDHRLLLRSSRPLLQSRNAAVVVSVAQLYHHCAPSAEAQLAAKALVRLLSSHNEIQCIVLDSIASMSYQKRGMFEYYLKHFFVRMSEPLRIKLLKLDVLTNLACDSNVSLILREMQAYLSCSDKVFAAATIQAIGKCACRLADIADSCLNGLVSLLSNGNEAIVAESVIVVKRLLQTKAADPKEIIRQMTKLLDSITVPNARAAILWLLGEHSTVVPLIAPDVLRKMAKTFVDETDIVKLQILNLATKLYLTNKTQTEQLCIYVFNLARYDQDYDIRDRARLLKPFVQEGKLNILSRRAEEIFLGPKPAPQLQSHFKDREYLQLGSLSHFINQPATGYEPLPSFPTVPPPGNVRDVEGEEQKSEKKRPVFWKMPSSRQNSQGSEYLDSGSSSSDISLESKGEESESSESASDSSNASSSEDSSSSGSSSEAESESEPERNENVVDILSEPPPKTSNHVGNEKTEKISSNFDLLIDLDEGDTFTPVLRPTNFPTVSLTDAINQNTPPPTISPKYYPTNTFEILDKISGRGLHITYKFSRSPHVYSPQMVNLILVFTNTLNEDITNIHIDQKLVPAVTIAKFSAIETLKPGLSVPVYLGIDFNDSLSPVSLDIISSLGTNTISLKPTIGELLRPVAISLQTFETHQGKLKGMNEHSVTCNINNAIDVCQKVFMEANVDIVQGNQDSNVYRFVGETLKSKSLVLIQVTVDNSVSIKVNCEKLVVGSMLLNELKQSLQQ